LSELERGNRRTSLSAEERTELAKKAVAAREAKRATVATSAQVCSKKAAAKKRAAKLRRSDQKVYADG
jgi:hypothetical protein